MDDEVFQIPVFMQQMAATITKAAGMLDQNQMAAFFQEMLVPKEICCR